MESSYWTTADTNNCNIIIINYFDNLEETAFPFGEIR